MTHRGDAERCGRARGAIRKHTAAVVGEAVRVAGRGKLRLGIKDVNWGSRATMTLTALTALAMTIGRKKHRSDLD